MIEDRLNRPALGLPQHWVARTLMGIGMIIETGSSDHDPFHRPPDRIVPS